MRCGAMGVRLRSATATGSMVAGAFVNCAGAWAAEIRHPGLLRHAGGRGGALEGTDAYMSGWNRPFDLPYVLRSPEMYLVPRGGGKIVIGATVERVGFDRRVDPSTIAEAAGAGGGALAPDCIGPGGGELERASAGHQRRVAPDWQHRDRGAGWRRGTFVTGSCWRRRRD